MLFVYSDGEDKITLSKADRQRLWDAFLDGGGRHSSAAATLPYIIRRCEREHVPYILRAMPGVGYHLEPYKEPTP